MTDSPLLEKAVLVQTPSGHALLDPYTTLLGPGIPLPWKIRSPKPPTAVPYDGMPSTSQPPPPKKRRKATSTISQNEQANIDLHKELREWLPAAIEEVRQAWMRTSEAATWYSTSRIVTSSLKNEDPARAPVDLVAWGKELDEIRDLQGEPEQRSDAMLWLEGTSSRHFMGDLFERVHANLQHKVHIMQTPAAHYLVPPKSGFLMADMIKWYDLLAASTRVHRFNMVLLDPPWRSKSVRRSENYEEMDMYDLYKIRLPELLAESAERHPVLVGVWVTNHAKCRRFVRDKLLPSWNVSDIVDWYWVKVTAGKTGGATVNGGWPVWSFDGASPRRCYEGLMLGYYNPKEKEIKDKLPDKRAFLSVPLEHSRKPLVKDLLKPYVQGSGTRVLEMFARYTPAGYSEEEEDSLWFSVGNEPLKYNEVEARWEGGQDGQCGTQGERLPTRPTPS